MGLVEQAEGQRNPPTLELQKTKKSQWLVFSEWPGQL